MKRQIGDNWSIKTDKSLTAGKNAEIVSPILQNTKQTWITLRKIGELLNLINPSYDECSFQVNFDGNLLPRIEDKVNFLKLYAMYEDIIYRFSKGEDEIYRSSLETYASPVILTLKGLLSFDNKQIIEMFSDNKRYGIVFKTKDKDLIEFRTPNMTSNPILWQNYITTFYYLLEFSKTKHYNMKEINHYLTNFNKIYILENYELEKKEKALVFAKTIFHNNNDFCNFMHQYLKIVIEVLGH